MLTTLDAVPWSKRTHAYGKAADVPDHLRAFAKGDEAARKAATFALAASLCHQGTLYAATVDAVPFLYELCAAREVADKHLLLRLLADIATADDHMPLLLGGIREPAKWPKKRDVFMNSFLAVRDGAEIAIPLLSDADARTRAGAAFLLAWFQAHAAASAKAMAARLRVEKDRAARASLALSLGFAAGYLESDAHDDALSALLREKDALVRAAGALALSTAHQGDIDEEGRRVLLETACAQEATCEGLPFCGGDLAAFAVRVVAATSGDDLEPLVLVVEKGPESAATDAANVVVRRLFEVEKTPANRPAKRAQSGGTRRREVSKLAALDAVTVDPSSFSPLQSKVLRALAAREEPWDRDVSSALGERGLPATHELLRRFLGESGPASALDREVRVGGMLLTVHDAIVAAADATSPDARAQKAKEIAAALAPDVAVEVAIAAYVELEGEGVYQVCGQIIAAAAPGGEAALKRLADRFATAGVPRAPDANGNMVTFTGVQPLVGIGLAMAALAKKELAPPSVDALLQAAFGYDPLVRDALRALPPDRREAWLLDPKRDDRAQPAEYFRGAWAYWAPYPSRAITERVLAHVATWKPKDPWGGPRKKHADPLLLEYIASLRAAGEEADAKRCEAALTQKR